MAITSRPSYYPNTHDLTSGNPAMRYFDAALAEVAPERANLTEVLSVSGRPLGNTSRQPVGRNPVWMPSWLVLRSWQPNTYGFAGGAPPAR